MGKLQWYINRLRAMNVREVVWRLDQKRIEKQEQKRFAGSRIYVGTELFNPEFKDLEFNAEALGINFANTSYNTFTEIHLLKGLDNDKWPDTFSYSLNYKQRDDLGDARTNWEKNRHFDWVLLAKAYYVTKDETYFTELQNTADEWMDKNPFLHGISWTSAMEFAIRSINWMYALAFLMKARNDNEDDNDNWASLCGKLRNGIINITEYLTKHYSRFSSANNHLLVEATAIGLAGYAFGHKPWQELAVRILTEELPKQNYSDGVNKELSLHYQTFGMEAYLLLAHVMQKNNDSRWKQWVSMLQKETEFVAHSTWREKVVCEFGDDDEGKILDLQGGDWHQWEWVLQLASLVTGVRYSNFEEICENTQWLFSEEEIECIKKASLYDTYKSRCFEIGGNSFLRDKEDRVLIGIDHAELGFGSIAAHGHADALSFQMLVDGEVVFADPGTYIYHCWLPERDKFRKTINHNTLCLIDETKTRKTPSTDAGSMSHSAAEVSALSENKLSSATVTSPSGIVADTASIDGNKQEKPFSIECFKDQSKMLGAFMWGDRANCRLVDYEIGDDKDVLVAEHDGYKPNVHRRAFHFDKVGLALTIKDQLSNDNDDDNDNFNYAVTFMLGQHCVVHDNDDDNLVRLETKTAIVTMRFEGQDRIALEDAELSPEYGVKVPTKAIWVYGRSSTITTTITITFNQR